MPCLVLQVRDRLERFELTDGAILGRGDDANVKIVDPTISRHHARFSLGEPLPSVEDLDSANGIRVDGDRIHPRDVLPDGAQVRFGDVAGWVFHGEPPFRLETGPTCSVCQWPVEPRQTLHRCVTCGVLYHRDCWNQNGGCGTYGCDQVGIAVPEASTDEPADSEAGLDFAPTRVTTSTDSALLAGAVIGSILGVLAFGLPAALVAVAAVIKKSLPAAALATAGTAVGLGVSWWWWMSSPV